jgi:hypothetical protein
LKSWLYSRRKGCRSIDSRFIIPTISFVGTILDYSVPIKMGSPDAYSATSSRSTAYDPLDINQDGVVSEMERLVGALKADSASSSSASASASASSRASATSGTGTSATASEGATSARFDLAQFASHMYAEIARNWSSSSSASTLNVVA